LIVTTAPGVGMTGEQLLQNCELLLKDVRTSPDGKVGIPQDGMPCWTYISAIQDVSRVVDDSLRPLVGFCPPEKSSLMQFIRIFVDYARRTPAELHYNGAWVSVAALSRAFPCR
jgi:Rap1a immunity proteins